LNPADPIELSLVLGKAFLSAIEAGFVRLFNLKQPSPNPDYRVQAFRRLACRFWASLLSFLFGFDLS